MKNIFLFFTISLILFSLINIGFIISEDPGIAATETTDSPVTNSIETTTSETSPGETQENLPQQNSEDSEESTSSAVSRETGLSDKLIESPETSISDETESSAEDLDKLEKEFKEEELNIDTGITPDSNFYFIEDQILSRFRDDLGNRERKVGEIREMIKKGDMESARISLRKYKEYAENLEKEVDPEKREEARRSAAAIYNTLKDIENELSKEDKKEFIDEILDNEKTIVTAAEISNKIKLLCEQLAGLDPIEYSKMCGIKDDAPDWQKKLDKKLTKEQEK